MDVTNSSTIGGSLQISTDVIAKIAKLATLEIEGVKEVSTGTMGVKSLFNKVNLQKPILVQLTDDVAEILSLIHISEPTRLGMISYAVFCLKKKKKLNNTPNEGLDTPNQIMRI